MASSRQYIYIPPATPAAGGCGCGGPSLRRTGRQGGPAGTGLDGQGKPGGTARHEEAPGNTASAGSNGPPGHRHSPHGHMPVAHRNRPVPNGHKPFPAPFPVPYFPGPAAAFVYVQIRGGMAAPELNQSHSARYHPGIPVGEALARTGAVRFGPGGRIAAVAGIPVVSGDTGFILRLNGRQIPAALLSFPLQANDTVELELVKLQREARG
ncbi:hypothetical protein ACFSL6_12365 [Paenibacillus thailandensis]|uniref:Uncharacterized protein n=1 Tax=Paenibacillus thailandensis TaxID=393250 RepID=A0ABW5R0A8_9BACL